MEQIISDDKEVFDLIILKVWTTKKSNYYLIIYEDLKENSFIESLKLSYLDDNNQISNVSTNKNNESSPTALKKFKLNLSATSKFNIRKSLTSYFEKPLADTTCNYMNFKLNTFNYFRC